MKIKELEDKIELLQDQISDEGKGAKRINEYLQRYFGTETFEIKYEYEKKSLDTLMVEPENANKKRFYVYRTSSKNEIATNLSEGEKILISFCYFLASLGDCSEIERKEHIIWIDDPISSLDSNHVYTVHAMIDSILVNNHLFKQLFVSTHNMEFFKLMNRLNPPSSLGRSYYYILNDSGRSTITALPKYIRESYTEFSHLFQEVFSVSKMSLDDVQDDLGLLHSFPNNARRFLEIYTYYRFPDNREFKCKNQDCFGDDYSLVCRIINEGSHGLGLFEQRAHVISFHQEILDVAKIIIEMVKENDDKQYQALLDGIGFREKEGAVIQ